MRGKMCADRYYMDATKRGMNMNNEQQQITQQTLIVKSPNRIVLKLLLLRQQLSTNEMRSKFNQFTFFGILCVCLLGLTIECVLRFCLSCFFLSRFFCFSAWFYCVLVFRENQKGVYFSIICIILLTC